MLLTLKNFCKSYGWFIITWLTLAILITVIWQPDILVNYLRAPVVALGIIDMWLIWFIFVLYRKSYLNASQQHSLAPKYVMLVSIPAFLSVVQGIAIMIFFSSQPITWFGMPLALVMYSLYTRALVPILEKQQQNVKRAFAPAKSGNV